MQRWRQQDYLLYLLHVLRSRDANNASCRGGLLSKFGLTLGQTLLRHPAQPAL